jgi:hypothetical protein
VPLVPLVLLDQQAQRLRLLVLLDRKEQTAGLHLITTILQKQQALLETPPLEELRGITQRKYPPQFFLFHTKMPTQPKLMYF